MGAESFQGRRMNAAREFDMPGLLGLREHLSIVHHLPGRIRLRLGVALWGAAARFERERFQGLLNGLEGIRQVRVNPAVASVVIEYDPRLVPPANWETLIGGDAAMATAILRQWLARHGQLLHDTLNGKA
jgi:hypothetical protein